MAFIVIKNDIFFLYNYRIVTIEKYHELIVKILILLFELLFIIIDFNLL